MGSSYELFRSPGSVVTLDEMSNRFDLEIANIDDNGEEADSIGTAAFSTEELILIATRMLRVASYWGADEAAIRNAGALALSSDKLESK